MVDLSTPVPINRTDQPESLDDVPSSSVPTRERRIIKVPVRYGFDNVNLFSLNAFVSLVEPKNIGDALQDNDWVQAMQEELLHFERNKVWRLVPCPKDRHIIGTRWVFRNKLDDSGTVIRNKALYGLKLAPRVCYDRLAKFLLKNGYRRGMIDRTPFILEEEGKILVVQAKLMIDVIILCSTNLALVEKFKDLMSSKFEMTHKAVVAFQGTFEKIQNGRLRVHGIVQPVRR